MDDMQAGQLGRPVVKLDRLPHQNSLEDLELLMEAWCEHGIANYRAQGYVIISKTFYLCSSWSRGRWCLWALKFEGAVGRRCQDFNPRVSARHCTSSRQQPVVWENLR